LCSNVSKVGNALLEESIWVGREDGKFKDVFLSVSYRSKEGALYYDHVGISQLANRIKEESLDNMHVGVKACCKDSSQVQPIIDLLEAHKLKEVSKIYMLSSTYGELSFAAMPMPSMDMNLELNYGKDFPEFHKSLVDSLNHKSSGLYLFHGTPGTGKSSYIKHLLSGEIARKIAYIPVSLINSLVSPDMLPLLMDNKDIVLVLEDAEKALLSRDISENSAIVSTILNLTDGFIGQALNISLIATFNTDKDKIDEALLRKGRLRLSHEFKKLSIEDGKALAKSIGKPESAITEEMSLADIYNLEDNTGYIEPETRRVGFF
jgi:hypothetical protein